MPRMADSIDPSALPPGMDAYLGYVDGRWPDYKTIAAAHNVPCYGLNVFGGQPSGSGDDAEPGDATVAQACADIQQDLERGVDRPIFYCPESWAASAVAAMNGLRVPRASWRLLTAHYGLAAHICGPTTCGCPVQADGTQWIDHGTWDESLLSDTFIQAAPHPGTTTTGARPMATLNAPIVAIVARPQGDGYWLIGQDGGTFAFGAAPVIGDPEVGKLAPGHYVRGGVSTPSGNGLWLTASDGGVLALGDAKFFGSLPALGFSPSTAPLGA